MKPLSAWLDGFAKSAVLVVGDLMLDEYLWGHIERISPEAPVPVLNLVRRESLLGGAGNVIRNLVGLEAQVAAVGVVGADAAGDRILELLDVLGVEPEGVVRDTSRKSTRKARLMSLEHSQQLFRLDEESVQPVCGEVEQRLVERIGAKAAGARVVVCSDYRKGLLTPRILQAAFAAARRQRIPAIAAPKDSNAENYRGATILMPNVRELAQLAAAAAQGGEPLEESARRLVEELGLQALVVTRGREGMALFEPGEGRLHRQDVPTVARSVYDVTGAGDTALAVLALAISSGADRLSAVHLANHAAGIVVGKRGTAAVTLEEIREQVERESAASPAPGASLSRGKPRRVP